ncbi:Proteophosphoglycan ppg4 [Rhodotorula diobovata]|uniref:Proteophosphoglycan ppg4 n=1 Tax=Rhodotorula diobovata TaxID=5288 RepID=A0A5C5G3N5_9BASI|nr:Proteophosphoglycan ppg4 [Rhodotorula diobovata]
MLRLSSIVRLGALAFLAIFVLHFLASFFSSAPDPSPYYDATQLGGLDDGVGWGERLGLDHYASWEEDVRGKVGAGLGRLKDGVGSITGLGGKGAKLGSLYELVATSNPSPGPAYFDARTSMDRLKLTSTRVLGHGGGSSSGSSDDATEDVDNQAFANRQRRHILVTGGFGSLGKAVVRDLLLNGGGAPPRTAAAWAAAGAPVDEQAWEEDVLVTILDVADRASELNFLLQSAPLDKPGAGGKGKGTDPRAKAFQASERSVDSFRKQGKLRVVVGDVRDAELVGQLLDPKGSYVTHLPGQIQAAALGDAQLGNLKQKGHATTTSFIPPVTGIIHLAAYSPEQCRRNPVDCRDVEEAGMKALLGSIEREGVDKEADLEGDKVVVADRPWVVLPRRADCWDEASFAHNGNASMLSVQAPEAALKAFTHKHPLHSLLVQLPSAFSVVGDPFSPRFDPVPHIVQSALGNLPVTVTTSSTQTEPFLAIDDASRSVVQGARMLDVASSKEYLRLLGFVGEVEIVGPPSSGSNRVQAASPLAELAQTAIALIQSQSPFATIEQPRAPIASPSDARFHVSEMAHRKTASKVLGFTPTISVETALRAYVSSILRLQTTYLSSRINVACSSPPSISVLEEGLLAMNGCNIQLLTLVEGAYHTLGCSQGLEGEHDEPLSLVSAVPYKEGVRGVEITAERGLEGKVDIQMRCPVVGKDGKLVPGESEVVMWADTPTGGEFAELSREGAHEIAEWFTVDFAQRDARSFTLTLPPTEGVPEGEEPKRRLTFREPNANRKTLLFQPTGDDAARALLWKFNPICCAATERRKDVWDFFHEDPLVTSQVSYPSEDGRTTLAESTLATRKCHDLRAEHDRITKVQQRLQRGAASSTSGSRTGSSSSSGDMCRPQYGEAATWTAKDQQTCSIDCSAPIPCIASDNCKCTRDRCGDARGAGPFPSVAYTDAKSFPPVSSPPTQSLAERVAALPWDAVIVPGARDAFRLGIDQLPKAHVVSLPESVDNHLKAPACYDLDRSPLPFMGDHYFVEALRNRSVSLDEAEFVMVPYFQGCYYNYLQENTFKKLADTIGHAEKSIASAQHITAERIVVPFTHDFGSCTGWWPKLEDVLGHSPPSPMDQAVAWQVNGDYNTRCVKADRDVVVPAVTKHTKSLFDTFKTPADVKPVLERKHLAFFAGGVRGFGALARTKIGCGRTGQDAESADILYQQFSPGQRYLGTLSASKFCLLPRGIPAWTTRTFEAIYSGCIPAFIVDRNSFPFQDVLDYSKFSVTIPEADAHRVDEVLATYTDAQLVELQAHLVKVRDAFLFAEGQEWERRGPLFFGLVSMAMRLPLTYPAVGSCATTS